MKNTVKILGANKALIENEEGQFLQSYNVIVCAKINGKIYFDKKYSFYSVTTTKHQSQFLGIDSKAQKKMIASGEAKLLNLN